MPEKINIPDQDDVLAKSERLEADNTRLATELKAATELLEAAQANLTATGQKADELAARLAAAETAAKVAGGEINRLQTENAQLTARMADFNRAVAAEVCKLGFSPRAADHKPAPAEADLTATQRVLAAKGVGSISDLSPQS